MSFHGTYTLGPIDFRRGEFLPGAVEPAAVRTGLVLSGGLLVADWVGSDDYRSARRSSWEALGNDRVLGVVGEEPVLRHVNGSVEVTVNQSGLVTVAKLLGFLRETCRVEIVTLYSSQVVTHRLLEWLAERVEQEQQFARAEGRRQ